MTDNHFLGHIDQVDGRHIVGWLHSSDGMVLPQLYVNGRPATLLDWPTPRPDVSEALQVSVSTGFRFSVSALPPDANISLYALSMSRCSLVSSETLPNILCEIAPLEQLKQAKIISQRKEAVAVSCWEGSHNPIGRAKVLYDILDGKRPAVLFTYTFRQFGGQIWLPVAQSNVRLVCIPWEERELYHQIIRRMGISFETVWICKPRVPSFQLASVLSTSNTRYILDLDDNEIAFTHNELQKDTIHGMLSESLSRYCIQSISERTVASVSLQHEFGGEIVRHARRKSFVVPICSTSKYKKIVFIGTARAHKGLLEAAQAIHFLNASSEIRISLHVYGDIPQILGRELADLGVHMKGNIAPASLFPTLAEMDAVLTGFSSDDPERQDINAYQISSKISDALAVGIPVLTPESPAVADLINVPGVYLFTKETFQEQCIRALSHTSPVVLPKDFTLDGAYKAFILAEQKARAGVILPFPASYISFTPDWKPAKPALVLLWKQHDAGLYGRRVDQIARSYVMHYPDYRVIIVEFLQNTRKSSYITQRNSFSSDASLILESAMIKECREGYISPEGVHHILLTYIDKEMLRQKFLRYIVDLDLSPERTIFDVFPIIDCFSSIQDFLEPFPLLVDFVDNQLFWATDEHRALTILSQYTALAHMADYCLFNSQDNLDSLYNKGVLQESVPVSLVPNWYRLPSDLIMESTHHHEDVLNVFYSGNMNDRINWDVLAGIGSMPGVNLHLVGAAQRVQDKMLELMKYPGIVYHGPKTERQTLSLLQRMDVAVIPHCQDNCSKFMNPMKTAMYIAAGIPVLSLRVSGIAEHPHIKFCADGNEMISVLKKWKYRPYQSNKNISGSGEGLYHAEQKYLQIIKSFI